MDKTFFEDVVSRIVIDNGSMEYGELIYTNLSKEKSKEMDCKFRFAPAWSSGFSNENTKWQTRCYLNALLKVKYFDDLIKVAHNLADLDQTKDLAQFNESSVRQKIGRLLNRCCIVFDGEAMRKTTRRGKHAMRLKRLIKNEWTFRIHVFILLINVLTCQQLLAFKHLRAE